MTKKGKLSKGGLIAMVMILALSMLLSACSSGSNENEGSDPKTEETEKSESATNSEEVKTELPEVKLVWYFPGNFPQADQELVFAEVNKVIKEKINATVEFKALGFGDYDQKMQVVIASGEAYDITFTSNWINNYNQNVAKGAFLPLDDLLVEYAPLTFAKVPKSFWEATKVQGKIYGFVNEQISARTPAVSVSKALAEKYSLDFDSISGKLGPDTLNLLEPFIQAVHTAEPQRAPFISIEQLNGDFFNYEAIIGVKIPGAVDYDDTSLTVVNQFESDRFKKVFATLRDWNAKGYTNSKERLSLKRDEWTETKAGKSSLGIGGTYKPGGEIQASSLGGEPFIEVPSGQAHLTTGGIVATMHAINRNSKNPERAMMLLELLNTDVELFNLLNFGIKDTHWKFDGDGLLVKEGDTALAYNPTVPWMFASNYLAYIEKGMPKTVWEDTKKLNENATPSNLLGFSFDAEPIKSEVGQVSAIFDEYYRSIELGVLSEEKYDVFLAKLKSAGSDKIIAEMQKQIDAWKATK